LENLVILEANMAEWESGRSDSVIKKY
jgi:hypothetical protein